MHKVRVREDVHDRLQAARTMAGQQRPGVDLSPGMLALARATAMDGHYDRWLLGDGSYPMVAYIGSLGP